LRVSADLAAELPGHVFIGGVAVYLRAANDRRTRGRVESSHDSDLMVSLVDFSSLRQSFEAVANPRLGKYQIMCEDVELDVYVEKHNRLVVPYDEVYAYADTIDGLRAASLEHLLVLKLEAYADRKGSAKGDKDERDLVTIAVLARGGFRPELCAPYLRDKHAEALERVASGRVFTEICSGNAHEAKKLRKIFEGLVVKLAPS